ncbi:MAG TPA: putative toxin-antitoxin system toxin component, PIN family [Chloroflexota bacterium]|nr:putative toxin-antitoxin system toxin component, PIN family [Chloroflexota bacterium]
MIELLGTLELVEPAHIEPVCRDPKDDVFLATAKAADADYLVSEDKDLLDLSPYEATRIITGRMFVEVLEEGRTD